MLKSIIAYQKTCSTQPAKLAVDLRNDIQRVALRISRGQIKSFSGPVELRRPHSRVNPI